MYDVDRRMHTSYQERQDYAGGLPTTSARMTQSIASLGTDSACWAGVAGCVCRQKLFIATRGWESLVETALSGWNL